MHWVRAWFGAYPQFAAADLDRVEHLKPVARELAFNLRDFGSDGAYGHFFNGPSTFDISADEFVVLELERLKALPRSEEHTSELQSLMRISYAVFCLKKKKKYKRKDDKRSSNTAQ